MESTIQREAAAAGETTRGVAKKITALMTPLILSNILQQLYNTIDALVISRYADSLAYAAVGIASSVMNLFLFLLVGACTGISVLFSRSYGSGDGKAFRNEHYMAFTAGLAGSALLAGIGIVFLQPILRVIHVSAELNPYTSVYLVIALLGMPASYLYNLYSAILRSVSKTGAVLAILAVSVTVNLFLDIFLVHTAGMGIAGAAEATVASQCLSALLSFAYIRMRAPELLFRKEDRRFRKADFALMARYAAVTALHSAGLYIGKLLVQGIVNSTGTDMIAGFTSATRIEGFANSFGDSGAAATSVITAQYYGAGKAKQIRQSFYASLLVLASLGAAMSIILFVTAAPASTLLIGGSGSVAWESSVSYLKTISFFYLLCFTGNTFVGWLDGLGKMQIPFIVATSHTALRFVIAWLLIGRLGLQAVSLACGIGWIFGNTIWLLCTLAILRRQKIQTAAESAVQGGGCAAGAALAGIKA